jgi:hypothetical protein
MIFVSIVILFVVSCIAWLVYVGIQAGKDKEKLDASQSVLHDVQKKNQARDLLNSDRDFASIVREKFSRD